MVQAFTSAAIRPALQCVRVSSKAECAQKLTVSLFIKSATQLTQNVLITLTNVPFKL